jgi:hypothetical protein
VMNNEATDGTPLAESNNEVPFPVSFAVATVTTRLIVVMVARIVMGGS